MSAPPPFDAASLDPPARTVVVMELATQTNCLWAVRDGDLKLIHLERGRAPGMSAGQNLLFDVVQDALETSDLGAGPGGAAQQRYAMLEAFHRHADAARAGCTPLEFIADPETEENLGGLGYAGPGAPQSEPCR